MWIIQQSIAMCSEVGLDERFLKLLFFDISQVGQPKICSFPLPYMDPNSFEEKFDCEFGNTWAHWGWYSLLGFQVIVAVVVFVFRRHQEEPNTIFDFLMVIEEMVTVILFASGICFGFYKELLMISISIYISLNSMRATLDGIV